MSDKARFYLEQSVPELQDLEKKGLFTKKEVKMIMRRWTEFEHRIMSRGSTPDDYLYYVRFEKNLEKLRKLRYQRMRLVIDTKKSISDYSASKRIRFIFDRGVRKFPNSMELWAQYLKYAKKNGSVKVVYKVYTRLLQLQPRNVNVWLSAAKYEYDYNKNVKSARNLLVRCLRFNGDELFPWLEFIKFELNYLSKLLIRRKLLNLITEKQQKDDLNEHEHSANKDSLAQGVDVVQVSEGSEIEKDLSDLTDLNASTLGTVENNPVLRGDLILTMYDACLEALTNKLHDNINEGRYEVKFTKVWEISNKVIDIVDQFDALDRSHINGHIISDLMGKYPEIDKVVLLELTVPIRYTDVDDGDFATSLKSSVKMYQSWVSRTKASDTVKTSVKKMYINYLTQRYLSKCTGEQKELLELLLRKLQ